MKHITTVRPRLARRTHVGVSRSVGRYSARVAAGSRALPDYFTYTRARSGEGAMWSASAWADTYNAHTVSGSRRTG